MSPPSLDGTCLVRQLIMSSRNNFLGCCSWYRKNKDTDILGFPTYFDNENVKLLSDKDDNIHKWAWQKRKGGKIQMVTKLIIIIKIDLLLLGS